MVTHSPGCHIGQLTIMAVIIWSFDLQSFVKSGQLYREAPALCPHLLELGHGVAEHER